MGKRLLLDRVATARQALGGFGLAEPLSNRALEIAEASNGADHPSVATQLGNPALLLKAAIWRSCLSCIPIVCWCGVETRA